MESSYGRYPIIAAYSHLVITHWPPRAPVMAILLNRLLEQTHFLLALYKKHYQDGHLW